MVQSPVKKTSRRRSSAATVRARKGRKRLGLSPQKTPRKTPSSAVFTSRSNVPWTAPHRAPQQRPKRNDQEEECIQGKFECDKNSCCLCSRSSHKVITISASCTQSPSVCAHSTEKKDLTNESGRFCPRTHRSHRRHRKGSPLQRREAHFLRSTRSLAKPQRQSKSMIPLPRILYRLW